MAGVSFQYGEWKKWLHCRFAIGNVRVEHSVSGWHYGESELTDAAIAMFGRATGAVARFQEEPGEYRWRIERLEVNRIRVRIYAFDDWDTDLPDEKGRLLFDGACGVVSFAQAIHNGFSVWLAGRKDSRKRENELRERLNTLAATLAKYDYPNPMPNQDSN